MILQAIPASIAESIEIASPPERRPETPIKLVTGALWQSGKRHIGRPGRSHSDYDAIVALAAMGGRETAGSEGREKSWN